MVVGLGALGAVTRTHARGRAGLRGAPARVRGARLGRAVRPLRRGDEQRRQRERLHPLGRGAEAVWVKSRRRRGGARRPARRARGDRRPQPDPGHGPHHATAQLGVPGPWSDRLPHFRMGFTPSSGEEIQSEYLVARGDAVAAIRAVLELGDAIGPLLAHVRDPLDGRRRAVDEPAVRAGHDRPALHLEARARPRSCACWPTSRPRWRRSRRARTGARCSLAGAARSAPLRAAARLPAARRAARPARRVPQRVAGIARTRSG